MAQADDKSVTFAWDYPTDYDQITHWKLYWGTQAGGPYETGEAQINKSMLGSTTQTDIVIQYPPNAKTTYYYVLVAFKDELYSANSNEVSVEGDFRENPLAPLSIANLPILRLCRIWGFRYRLP